LGLSIVISGGIVLFALIYILLTLPGIVNQTVSITKASTAISDVENSILKTNIKMQAIYAASGSGAVNFTVANTGTEKLWNFEKFNLIVTYPIAGQTRSELLSYTGSCAGAPSSGTWCIASINSDNLDPKLLNTNESLNIRSRVNQTPISGTVSAAISTDNGIVATNATST
jgi:archaellum component FlaF (FlaF/FlaG flagellin family)